MIMLKNCRLIPELTEGFDLAKADVIIDEEKIRKLAEPALRILTEESLMSKGQHCCRDFSICMPICTCQN